MLRHAIHSHARATAQATFNGSLKLAYGDKHSCLRCVSSSRDGKHKLFTQGPAVADGVPVQPSNTSAAGFGRQLSSTRTPPPNNTDTSTSSSPSPPSSLSGILGNKKTRSLKKEQNGAKSAQKPASASAASDEGGMISDILKNLGSSSPHNQQKPKQHGKNRDGKDASGQKGGLLNHNLQDSFSRKKKIRAEMQVTNRNNRRQGSSNQQHNQQLDEMQASANAIADNLLELIEANKAQGRARWEKRESDIHRKRAKRRANMPEGPASISEGNMMSMSDFKNSLNSKLAVSKRRGNDNAKAKSQSVSTKQPTTVVKEVVVPDNGMTARELAIAMSMKSKDLMKRLRALGETIRNDEEVLEADVVEIVVLDQGLQVKRVKTEKDFGKRQLREASTEAMDPRAPVVCVMGHVDHGKTSLLDALRKSKVASGEAGGITQRLAAFSVSMNSLVSDTVASEDRSVVFLDTPGHAAFSAMRAHGANATDIACIMVAAVEGVQPQTIESINFAREGGASIVVAISKIDRIPEDQQSAAINRIKTQLADLGVVSEDFGGDVPVVPVSSVTGHGLQHLVEQVLLQAEVLELQAVHDGAAQSVVLDTNTEKGIGCVADVLVQWGRLCVGDTFVVGNAYGRIRQMTDAFGNRIKEALPSTPIRITGLKSLPDAGEELLVVEDESRAREIAARRHRLGQMRQMRGQQDNSMDEESECLHIMLKADTHGTMDALCQIVSGIDEPEMKIKIVGQSIGPISRSDIQMAILANRCPIMCFNVGFGDNSAKGFAKEEDVSCATHNVIYRIEDEIKNMIHAKLPKVAVLEKKGGGRVQQTFQLNDKKNTVVAGCIVSQGVLRSQGRYRITRGDTPVTDFIHLESLRRHKDVVQEVSSGSDCGLVFSKFSGIKDGDTVEFYEIVQKPKRLLKGDDILFEQEATEATAEAVNG